MKYEYDRACPAAGDNLQGWCDYRNARLNREDVQWVIDWQDNPALEPVREVANRRAKADLERHEAERQRFIHRTQHPIGD
jgi:hypothetical protein